MTLCNETVYNLREKIKNKEVSAKEVTECFIKRIEDTLDKTNAYITKTFDSALKEAENIDEKILRGEDTGVLGGVPYALKDNLCTKDVLTTCSSKLLSNFVPPYSATVYKKIQNAGGVLLGKLDMDEFAMGSSTETSSFNEVRNPWNTDTVPGGSSGGSSAAVAASQAAFALGSDTGGSIRNPASFCGITGLKPTYGTVSRYGLIAFASSLDQIGPLTRDVKDAALILNVISGHDENDSTSLNMETPDYTSYLKEGIEGMRVGVDYSLFERGIDEDIVKQVTKAIDTFKDMGAEIVDVSFNCIEYAIPVYYLISSSEASSNLSRFDGIRYGVRADGKDVEEILINSRSEGFGDEVKRRIMLGTYSLSAGYYDAYYNKAMKVRRLIKDEYKRVFEKCDITLTPTSPTVAFKRGEKIDDPATMHANDIFTVTANLCGIPSMSVPCGFNKDNMPIGLQIGADVFMEKNMLKAGYNYQLNTDYHKQRPNI